MATNNSEEDKILSPKEKDEKENKKCSGAKRATDKEIRKLSPMTVMESDRQKIFLRR